MKRLSLAFCFAFAMGTAVLAALVWTRPKPAVLAIPETYSAFTVEIDCEWIRIRNVGDQVLTKCSIDYIAELNSPEYKSYHGSRLFDRWEPGEEREIGISLPRGRADVRSVRFTGLASVSDSEGPFRKLAYPVGASVERLGD